MGTPVHSYFCEVPRAVKVMPTESRVAVARGWEGGGSEELLINRYRDVAFQGENVLEIGCTKCI